MIHSILASALLIKIASYFTVGGLTPTSSYLSMAIPRSADRTRSFDNLDVSTESIVGQLTPTNSYTSVAITRSADQIRSFDDLDSFTKSTVGQLAPTNSDMSLEPSRVDSRQLAPASSLSQSFINRFANLSTSPSADGFKSKLTENQLPRTMADANLLPIHERSSVIRLENTVFARDEQAFKGSVSAYISPPEREFQPPWLTDSPIVRLQTGIEQ